MSDQCRDAGVSVRDMVDAGDVPVTSSEMASFGLPEASSDLVDLDEEPAP